MALELKDKLRKKMCRHRPLVSRLRRVEDAGLTWWYGETICLKCYARLRVNGILKKAEVIE